MQSIQPKRIGSYTNSQGLHTNSSFYELEAGDIQTAQELWMDIWNLSIQMIQNAFAIFISILSSFLFQADLEARESIHPANSV
jgi:hypothetical protein